MKIDRFVSIVKEIEENLHLKVSLLETNYNNTLLKCIIANHSVVVHIENNGNTHIRINGYELYGDSTNDLYMFFTNIFKKL